MDQVIQSDIENLIECLHQYNSQFSLDFLRNRYLPNITIKKPKLVKKTYEKRSNKTSKHFVPKQQYRCIARCWGDNPPVKYDVKTKSWIYGKQCSRYKTDGDYCAIHYKQYLSPQGLKHGVFSRDPPHSHYIKHKKKIENRFKVVSEV
tara:strand:- start:1811 stop:2254 length:444 start_codon:yes stop_codon:yes gene_type:complete